MLMRYGQSTVNSLMGSSLTDEEYDMFNYPDLVPYSILDVRRISNEHKGEPRVSHPWTGCG